MLGVIDYGIGNLKSFLNLFELLKIDAELVPDPTKLSRYEKLILPGVGHFEAGVTNFCERGFEQPLKAEVFDKKKPILGICLGMQILLGKSEEGGGAGLNWIAGSVVAFKGRIEPKYRIPHVGFNRVRFAGASSQIDPLFRGINDGSYFYFTHSYYVQLDNSKNQIASTDYDKNFTCAYRNDNIWGVQFHPEKSHDAGLTLLKNFAEMPC